MYPKVLIVSSLNKNSANGITIRNLFSQWPKEKIAVIDTGENSLQDVLEKNIDKYYLLGNKEVSFIKPFNLFRNIDDSRVITAKEINEAVIANKSIRKNNFIKQFIYNIQILFLNLSGLVFVTRNYKYSKELINWVNEIAPDIIYVSMGDISTMRFFSTFQTKFNTPVAIHVFDDFVHSSYRRTIFRSYWKKQMETSFLNLLKNSSIHLSISEKMADEYKEKYGFTFHSFHNPIDEELWIDETPKTFIYDQDKTFTFLYAGKISRDTGDSLISFYNAIKSLQREGWNVNLHVYSPYKFEEIYRNIGSDTNKIYKGKVDYKKLPQTFGAADGLLLALNNSKATIEYIRLSMLTKATEYMATQSPIFLYAPKDIAVSEYLLSHNAAYCVDNNKHLKEKIKIFIKDAEMRNIIAQNALNLVKSKHTKSEVSKRLVDVLRKYKNNVS